MGDGVLDAVTTDFGMRKFSTSGTQFTINGLKTFLRGKHDACIFPLTGHPPMDVESWRELLRTAKSYNMNFFRFHSWTSEAAALQPISKVYICSPNCHSGAVSAGQNRSE